MSHSEYPGLSPNPAPDFGSREWWLDEFGSDNRPYTDAELIAADAGLAHAINATIPVLFPRKPDCLVCDDRGCEFCRKAAA